MTNYDRRPAGGASGWGWGGTWIVIIIIILIIIGVGWGWGWGGWGGRGNVANTGTNQAPVETTPNTAGGASTNAHSAGGNAARTGPQTGAGGKSTTP